MSDGIANPRRPDEASISIHPKDAAMLGLYEGDRARISTTKGMLEAPVRFDSRYRRGVVSVPHGFGHINVNVLTDAQSTDPLSGMVQLGGIPIQIERAEQAVV